MIEKLKIIKQKFDEISDLIIQPHIISDQKKYIKLNKEYKDLKLIVDVSEKYFDAKLNFDEAEQIIKEGSDKEMIELAKSQFEDSKINIEKLESEIKYLLIPKDPDDSKNVVVEIRAGTGGDEAVSLLVIYIECILNLHRYGMEAQFS